MTVVNSHSISALREIFGESLRENVSLAAYTSARIGGPADALITVRSAGELAETVMTLREHETAFFIMGAGSNVLISDKGVRGVVVINRAREVRFNTVGQLSVWAESGATLSNLARRAAARGLSGLEWAATVPGSVGGAVYGNAGAHGGDIARDLLTAEVLSPTGEREQWTAEQMAFGYRTSILKRGEKQGIILSAEFKLEASTQESVEDKIEQFTSHRRSTQPPGASMGSMFKNPPGDYAGRLIEAAGLKGRRVGNAEISKTHANFFINSGETSAQDIRTLIDIARTEVEEKFGVTLELEIELLGEW